MPVADNQVTQRVIGQKNTRRLRNALWAGPKPRALDGLLHDSGKAAGESETCGLELPWAFPDNRTVRHAGTVGESFKLSRAA